MTGEWKLMARGFLLHLFSMCIFSWVVYRCQTIDQSIVKTKEPHTGNKLRPATDDWGVADTDDWGTDGANDWGAEGSDNWGAGADDWGMEGTEDMTSQVDIGEKKNGESACSSEINTRVRCEIN